MFVSHLLQHPNSTNITILNLSNAMIPDPLLVALSEQCYDHNGLPQLQVLHLESNLLGQDGIVALSKCIANPKVWTKLQILKLENQKKEFTSTAEEALGNAVLQCSSLVVVSLRVRDGLARQQINNTVAANMDILRRARREIAAQTGTLKERKRNEMEVYFDTIAAARAGAANGDGNGGDDDGDSSIITDVTLTGNLNF